MFAKVRWSQNMFLWIRKVFCSHLAYPKPFFLYTGKSKLIENRIWQNVDRNRSKMLVITAVLGTQIVAVFRQVDILKGLAERLPPGAAGTVGGVSQPQSQVG